MSYKLKTQNLNGIIIQTGEGIPTHVAIPKAIYIDLLTNYEYIFTTGWFLKNSIQKVLEINMNDAQDTIHTILPQIPNTLFVPTSLILTTTRITGIPSSGLLSFSQGGGPSHGFTFNLANQDSLKEVTYIFDESYGGRTAIDLHSEAWMVTLTQQSNLSTHFITLITNGTLIPYTPLYTPPIPPPPPPVVTYSTTGLIGFYETLNNINTGLVNNIDNSETAYFQNTNTECILPLRENISKDPTFTGSMGDWDLEGWILGTNKATYTGSSDKFLHQWDVVQSTKTYKITFEVSDCTSGQVRCGLSYDGEWSGWLSSSGTYSYILQSNVGDCVVFEPTSLFRGSISNVYVDEVFIYKPFDYAQELNRTIFVDINDSLLTNNNKFLVYDTEQNLTSKNQTLDYLGQSLLEASPPMEDLVFWQDSIYNNRVVNKAYTSRQYPVFDGTTNQINTGFAQSTTTGTRVYLVINLSNLTYQSGDDYIFDNTDGSTGFHIRMNSGGLGGLRVVLYASTSYTISTTRTITDNITQIAIRYDDGYLELWINGKIQNRITAVGNILAPNGTSYDIIGSEFNGINESKFNCLGVARTSNKMTEAEWLRFLKMDLTLKDKVGFDYFYKCDEGTGNTIIDYSDNNRTGTLTGTATWGTLDMDALAQGIEGTSYIPINQVIDFTNNGTNTNIPNELNSWSYNTSSVLDNKLHFYREVSLDGNVVGTTDHLIYRKQRYMWICAYTTGRVFKYKEDGTYTGEYIDLMVQVLSKGSTYNTTTGRFQCRDMTYNNGYFYVLENLKGWIYIFDENFEWTGNYIDTENQDNTPEALCYGIDSTGGSYLYSMGRSTLTIHQYTLGNIIGGVDMPIGSYIQSFPVPQVTIAGVRLVLYNIYLQQFYLFDTYSKMVYVYTNEWVYTGTSYSGSVNDNGTIFENWYGGCFTPENDIILYEIDRMYICRFSVTMQLKSRTRYYEGITYSGGCFFQDDILSVAHISKINEYLNI